MSQFLDSAFTGPPLPATILLMLVMGYWVLVIVGMVDLDALDLDLDLDLDVDADADFGGALESALSFGMLPLRWLNLGRVPLMLWISVFALAFWLTSVLWDTPAGRENGWNMAAVIIRNGAIALLACKLLTQPLRGVFNTGTNVVGGEDLLGLECFGTTRITEDRGQAKLETGRGAPLLLSVRCEYGEMQKGERAEIIGYDVERDIYFVRPSAN